MTSANDHYVGIDLGTTNSVVFHVRSVDTNLEDALTTLRDVRHASDRALLPSAVAFKLDGSEKLFGDAALAKVDDPEYAVVTLSKLVIGRKWPDDDLMTEPNASVRVVPSPANPLKPVFQSVHDASFVVTPEEIAAEILDYLLGMAVRDLPDGAVVAAMAVTLPAHFNDRQRQATKAAGEAAMKKRGFDPNVVTLNEPTAALYASLCRMTAAQRESCVGKTTLVVDVGGGTTDVSLVDVGRNGDRIELMVRATSGNNQLGGAHFDRVLERMALERMKDDDDVDDDEPVLTTADRAKLRDAKQQLAGNDRVKIDGFSRYPDFEMTVTRTDLAEAASAEVEGVEACLDDALAGVDAGTIHSVVFVGGSSRLDVVRSATASALARHGNDQARLEFSAINVDTAVAEGAALFCLSNSAIGGSRIAGSTPMVADVIPRAIGVKATVDGVPNRFSIVLPRFHRCGTWASKPVSYINLGRGDKIRFDVYEGLDDDIFKNEYIDNFIVSGPREYDQGTMTVDVNMFVSIGGILEVKAVPTGDLAKELEEIHGSAGVKLIKIQRSNAEGLEVDATALMDELKARERRIDEMSRVLGIRKSIRKVRARAAKAGVKDLPDLDTDDMTSETLLNDALKELEDALEARLADAAKDDKEEEPATANGGAKKTTNSKKRKEKDGDVGERRQMPRRGSART